MSESPVYVLGDALAVAVTMLSTVEPEALEALRDLLAQHGDELDPEAVRVRDALAVAIQALDARVCLEVLVPMALIRRAVPRSLTVSKAALVTGMTERAVRYAVQDGRLLGRKVGKAYQVHRRSARAFLRSDRGPTGGSSGTP